MSVTYETFQYPMTQENVKTYYNEQLPKNQILISSQSLYHKGIQFPVMECKKNDTWYKEYHEITHDSNEGL